MLKMNRTTEYALIALRYMSARSEAVTAREIAERFGLPSEITAKTLQRLKDLELIRSIQGARGGYVLGRSLSDVTLSEFLTKVEGGAAMVQCASPPPVETPNAHGAQVSSHRGCEFESRCEIQSFLGGVQSKVLGVLDGIRLSEVLR
jgi:Rrf2 family protein